jgi:hypothetical protein
MYYYTRGVIVDCYCNVLHFTTIRLFPSFQIFANCPEICLMKHLGMGINHIMKLAYESYKKLPNRMIISGFKIILISHENHINPPWGSQMVPTSRPECCYKAKPHKRCIACTQKIPIRSQENHRNNHKHHQISSNIIKILWKSYGNPN